MFSVLLNRDAEHAAQIDAFCAGRRDAADQLLRYRRGGACVPAIQYQLHFHRVPGHDDVGEQAQRVGDGQPANAAALGIDTKRLAIAGHSMGGWVTARFWTRFTVPIRSRH